MKILEEYPLVVSEVAKIIGASTTHVKRLADLPEDSPNRIPCYWMPRVDGKKDRRFRPEDVAKWQKAHGLTK